MDTKENAKNIDVWKRGLFILIYGVIFYFLFALIWLVVIFQFVMKLVTGNLNEQILDFSDSLNKYVSHILLYITFKSEDRPFPFSPWSGNEIDYYKKPAVKAAEKPSFTKKYYDFLIEKKRTQVEAEAFIKGEEGYEVTSKNVKRDLSHYMGIHNLVENIRTSNGIDEKSAADFGRSGFASKFYAFLYNKRPNKNECLKYIMGKNPYEETSSNIQKNKSHYIGIYNLVRTVRVNMKK